MVDRLRANFDELLFQGRQRISTHMGRSGSRRVSASRISENLAIDVSVFKV